MIVRDFMGIDRNTEKIYGIESRYSLRDGSFSYWSLMRSYKTEKAMYDALNHFKKSQSAIGYVVKYRPCYVYHIITKEEYLNSIKHIPKSNKWTPPPPTKRWKRIEWWSNFLGKIILKIIK